MNSQSYGYEIYPTDIDHDVSNTQIIKLYNNEGMLDTRRLFKRCEVIVGDKLMSSTRFPTSQALR